MSGTASSSLDRQAEMQYREQGSVPLPSPPSTASAVQNAEPVYGPIHPNSTSSETSPVPPIHHLGAYSPKSVPSSAAASFTSSPFRKGSSGAGRESLYGDASNPSAIATKGPSNNPSPGHAFFSRYLGDLEKADSRHPSAQLSNPTAQRSNHPTKTSSIGNGVDQQEDANEHTVWILVSGMRAGAPIFRWNKLCEHLPPKLTYLQIYLSFISPFLTLITSIYTIATTILLLLLSPITVLCKPRRALGLQCCYFLAPVVRFQLRLLSSEYVEDFSHPNRCKPRVLVLVNVFSPIHAAGTAVAAWVAAGFWFTAAILGDPDGTDSRDDGRAAVLGVGRWWEKWLVSGLNM
ncbi:MAG: hypothetical protein Q9214_003605 [Letrouitia sp. 1 TL-2023]